MERPTPDTTTPDTTPATSPDTTPAAAGAGLDSDAGTLGAARIRRPVHLHPGFVLVVVCGGVAGALARYGLGTVLPSPGG